MNTFQIPEGTKEVKIDQVDNKIIVEFVKESEEFEPKDGDIVSTKWWIHIFNGGKIFSYKYYAACRLDGSCLSVCGGLAMEQEDVGLATESEKQLLFDKLAEQGYWWNAEEKKIEKTRWRAEKGEIYWTFDSFAVFKVNEFDTSTDRERYAKGFYFQTKEQAEKAFEAVKNLLLNTKF